MAHFSFTGLLPSGALKPEKLGKKDWVKDEYMHAWCSWCRKYTAHGLAQKNIFSRNVYKCMSCLKRTLCCRWQVAGECRAMARGHDDWDDDMCLVCGGYMTEWTGAAPSQPVGYCSWCYRESTQQYIQGNIVRNDVFQCDSCANRTVRCATDRCNAFARNESFITTAYCALHGDVIRNWSDVEGNRRAAAARCEQGLERHNPYESFAPWRENITCNAYISGHEFYHAVADAIEAAKDEVFMSFWHMSSFIYLKRNHDQSGEALPEYWRVDNLLKRKAEEGVRIYILLWNEPLPFVNNFSREAESTLQALHPNIKVVRHPILNLKSILWSHHQKFVVIDQQLAFVGGLDICLGRYDDIKHDLVDGEKKKFPGVDYYNPHFGKPKTIDRPLEDYLDRTKIPRMPWHDVSVSVDGDAARDCAYNFIQRWNHHTQEMDIMPILTPHRASRLLTLRELPAFSKSTFDLAKEFGWEKPPEDTLEEASVVERTASGLPGWEGTDREASGSCLVQVVRSVGLWSAGLQTEASILGAYMKVIQEAQHYIYIENQYISSSLAGGGVENRLMELIMEKVSSKITSGETFRAIFVLPHPEDRGDELRGILKWQYQTISRGGYSILEQLEKRHPGVDLEEYICFIFLRAHGMLEGEPVTEKVFVHSKLMVVDDETVIVSSANFNDRSMLGDRDSELGLVIKDMARVDGVMDGQPTEVGRFPHEFRLRLWQAHMDLTGPEAAIMRDPISRETYNGMVLAWAKRNTDVFEKVFPFIPSANIRSWEDFVKSFHGKADAEHLHMLDDIKGFMTLYPHDFLIEDSLDTLPANFLGAHIHQ